MTNFIQENTARISETRALVGRVQDQINLQESDFLRMQKNIDRLVKEKAVLTDELIREVGKRIKAEKNTEITVHYMILVCIAGAVQLGWVIYSTW